MTEAASDLFRAGRLADSVAALTAEVKAKPADVDIRVRLAELLCFQGNFDRADKLLDAAGTLRPELAASIALFRQLIRAAVARRQTFAEGRLPEFLGEPPAWLRTALLGLTHLRTGDAAQALAALDQAEAERAPVAGTCDDGKRFENLRDLDDVTAGFFEVLTSTGKYFWIPFERIASVEFRPPQRASDALWRRAEMSVIDGPDGEVFVPVLYDVEPEGLEEALLLGRETAWRDEDGAPVRGIGQRCLLIGEEAVPIMEIESLDFDRDGDAAS
jgi:type VI secretion system protein ImpE